MERQATQSLSLDQAKARLRAAAEGGNPFAWVWSSPKEAALAAFIIGMIVGTSPTARDVLTRGIVALLKHTRP